MAKRSREQIREDEKDIIALLEKDGRQTPNEIAKKLGFSRQKAWRIIKKLEKTEEIWGYTTIIDERKSNRTIYLAIIKSKAPLSEYTDKLISRVKNNKAEEEMKIKIIDLFFIQGCYDWIILFSANDIRHANRFMGYIQKNYEEMIDKIEMLENIFTLKKAGKINPKIEELSEFALE